MAITMTWPPYTLLLIFATLLLPGTFAENKTEATHRTGSHPDVVKHLHSYISEAKDPLEKAKRANDAASILHQKLVQAIWNRFPTTRHFAEFVHSVVKDEKIGLGWTCRLEILRTLESLIEGQMWPIEMLDSWGKPGPGLLKLNGFFRGDYKQCVDIKPIRPPLGEPPNPKDDQTLYDRLLASFPSNHGYSNRNQRTQNVQSSYAQTSQHENAYSRPITEAEYSHVIDSNQSALIWPTGKDGRDFNGEMVSDKTMEFLNDVTRMLKLKERMEKVEAKKKMFKTKYCRVGATSTASHTNFMEVPIIKVYMGASLDVCIPEDCSASDLNILVNETIKAAMFGSNPGIFIPEESTCHERIHLESKTIGVLAFIVVGLGWLAFATTFDIWRIQRPRWKLERLKESFIRKRADLLKSTENGQTHGHGDNGHVDNSHDVIINNGDRSNLVESGAVPARMWAAQRVQDGQPSQGAGGEDLEDILFKPPPIPTGQRIIQFFSVYTNGAKILNTNVPPETLTTLHGMRFLSMCWIIVGHTLLIGLVSVANIPAFMNEMKQQTWFLIIANGFLCVDVFFVISGMMVGYFFRDISDHPSRFKWMVYVLHRFVRLTPATMVTMAVYIGLWPYLSTGPGYPDRAPDEEMCKETWWYTLLYINNFLPLDKLCLMWTWYLSCDYQFYLVCTVFMIPLHKGFHKFGVTLAVVFALASMVAGGVMTYTHHMAEMLPQFVTTHGFSRPLVYYNYFYQRPYCRMGPYVVGLMLGYVLQRTKRNIYMPWWLVIVGWVLSTVVALSTLLGIHESWAGHHLMSDVQIAVYNATKHTAFGLAVAWVLLACLTGYGGYVNTILSWKPFIPLSRLTYCTYLVHPPLIYLYFYSQNGPVWLNPWNLIFTSIAITIVSIGLGAGLSVFVESPTIQLEREILIRLKFITPRNM